MGMFDNLIAWADQMQQDQYARQDKRLADKLKPILGGFGTETAGQIGNLLTSRDPRSMQIGQGLLAQALQLRGGEAMLDPIQKQQLANAKDQASYARSNQQAQSFGNMLEAIKFRDYQRQLPMQERQQRNALTLQEQEIAANRAAANPPPPSQAMQDAAIWTQQNGAPIPSGFRPQRRFARDQQGQPVQFIDVQPVEGTKPYTEAETALRTQERMVENLNSFLDTLSTTGTEFRGKEALKLSQLRSRIIADYAALQNLGVLQPGEIKNLSEILPDPTAFANQLNPWAADNIAAVYEQLLQQQEAKTMDLRQQFWFINPKPLMPGE